jgi:hypothetical protein
LPDLVREIIDALCSPDFALNVRDDVQISGVTTSYVYKNSATYPYLFDFLAEILHAKIPLEVEDAKFGPGEIIVAAESKELSDNRLTSAFKELQKLVHGKREQALAKYA